MSNAMRLQVNGQYFVAHRGDIYADKNGDGKIERSERVSGDPAGVSRATLTGAAKFFEDTFSRPHAGLRTLDGAVRCEGQLNGPEQAKFEKGDAVPEKRKDVWGHLDFFDGNQDGKLELSENYGRWRDLGFGKLRSGFGAAASNVVFSGALKGPVSFVKAAMNGFAVDVEQIQDRRPKSATGIYDKQTGNIDRARLDAFLAEFDTRGDDGVLTHDQLEKLIEDKGGVGFLSKNQFKSLKAMTKRINGSETVSKAQFEGLYDSTLMYTAAAVADQNQH